MQKMHTKKGNTMFQKFNDDGYPKNVVRERINKLRKVMKKNKVDVFVIPHSDQYLNEYLAVNEERLKWITGFTGSAGTAVITQQKAVLFVDGRYKIQATKQVDTKRMFGVEDIIMNPPHIWIEKNIKGGQVVGVDPWLHSINDAENIKNSTEGNGGKFKAMNKNLVDEIWDNQPEEPNEPVRVQPLRYAGKSAGKKIGEIKRDMGEADVCVVCEPASVCWLLNIRGGDVKHTPITLARAIVTKNKKVSLFVETKKVSSERRSVIARNAEIKKPEMFKKTLAKIVRNKRVIIDLNQTPFEVVRIIEKSRGKIVGYKNPITIRKAIKNNAEIKGTKNAHLRDGAAVVTFLKWISNAKNVTEIDAAKKLENIRKQFGREMMTDISFDTISGSNQNGAIIHYRVTEESNKKITKGVYLFDSGAQYIDGTTDITRTIAVGKPSEHQKKIFTLVLKGHINVATAKFPKGTRGLDIDPLARASLRQYGCDYPHGTGHGVGAYLSVHEGPQNISPYGAQQLLEGMIVSNEPGYYKKNKFGVRIENLLLVRKAKIKNDENDSLEFENLTFVPIDKKLVEPKLLSGEEKKWLNEYHSSVWRKISPLVSDNTKGWLRSATSPIK